jgi:hypothetical protein
MLSTLSNRIWSAWLNVPHRWRRRIVIAAIVWSAIRIFIATFGFGLLLFWLLAGLALAYLLAETGLRKADAAETWIYARLTGQLQGIVTGALIPVVAESWGRYFASRTQDELIISIIVTALLAYTVLLMRKSFSGALDSTVKSRRAARRGR